jgi:hypothetical protein
MVTALDSLAEMALAKALWQKFLQVRLCLRVAQ